MASKKCTQIDRSNENEVNKYITCVFIYLKKYKTQDILNAFFAWYKSKPGRVSINVQEFDVIPRKNIEDFNNKRKTVDVAYGDEYAILLTKFVRANKVYENELIKIAENLVVISKFEGKKLGLSKLLSSFDMILIKEVFKLLRNTHGISTVTQVTENSSNILLEGEETDKDTCGMCYQTNKFKYKQSRKSMSNKSVDLSEKNKLVQENSLNLKSKILLDNLSNPSKDNINNSYSGNNGSEKSRKGNSRGDNDNEKNDADSLEYDNLTNNDITTIKTVDLSNNNKLTDIKDLINKIDLFTITSETIKISKCA